MAPQDQCFCWHLGHVRASYGDCSPLHGGKGDGQQGGAFLCPCGSYHWWQSASQATASSPHRLSEASKPFPVRGHFNICCFQNRNQMSSASMTAQPRGALTQSCNHYPEIQAPCRTFPDDSATGGARAGWSPAVTGPCPASVSKVTNSAWWSICQARLLIRPSDGVRPEVQRTSRSLFQWKLFYASMKSIFLEKRGSVTW